MRHAESVPTTPRRSRLMVLRIHQYRAKLRQQALDTHDERMAAVGCRYIVKGGVAVARGGAKRKAELERADRAERERRE